MDILRLSFVKREKRKRKKQKTTGKAKGGWKYEEDISGINGRSSFGW